MEKLDDETEEMTAAIEKAVREHYPREGTIPAWVIALARAAYLAGRQYGIEEFATC